jgi:hypothetical protein
MAGTYSPRARSGDQAALGLGLWWTPGGPRPTFDAMPALPIAPPLEAPPVSRHDRAHVTLDWVESPLGRLVAGATDTGVCLLEFSEPGRLDAQIRTLERRLGCAVTQGEHPLLTRLEAELVEYFAG